MNSVQMKFNSQLRQYALFSFTYLLCKCYIPIENSTGCQHVFISPKIYVFDWILEQIDWWKNYNKLLNENLFKEINSFIFINVAVPFSMRIFFFKLSLKPFFLIYFFILHEILVHWSQFYGWLFSLNLFCSSIYVLLILSKQINNHIVNIEF